MSDGTMSRKRGTTKTETVLLKQTSDDRYLKAIKVLHALAGTTDMEIKHELIGRYGSAANAVRIIVEASEEFKILEPLLFPMCQNVDSWPNGRNSYRAELAAGVAT